MIAAVPRIFLFLSTGRCGTQWLAHNLAELAGEEAVVTHEPLGPHYRPRDFFRGYDDLERYQRVPEVRDHLRRIGRVMDGGRTYIETGWPLFAALPLFIQEFGDAVGIVHLSRHPVPTAVSHMVHQCYWGSPRDDDYTRLGALDPSLPGAFQKDHRAHWGDLSPYEKCLFWWTEVHLYARELRLRYPAALWHFIPAEDVFSGAAYALEQLALFLGVPHGAELARRAGETIDRWHHHTRTDFDWRAIFDHPAALEAAAYLGYDFGHISQEDLDRRYKGEPAPSDHD